jgi:hypothetical protein
MLADLDLLLTAVFATADDLLPSRSKNAGRIVTDAEVVTLAVAQAIMDIASDREFLAVAGKRVRHLIPRLPKQRPSAAEPPAVLSGRRLPAPQDQVCVSPGPSALSPWSTIVLHKAIFPASAKRLRAEHRRPSAERRPHGQHRPQRRKSRPSIERSDAATGDPRSGRSPTCRPSLRSSRAARRSPG